MLPAEQVCLKGAQHVGSPGAGQPGLEKQKSGGGGKGSFIENQQPLSMSNNERRREPCF